MNRIIFDELVNNVIREESKQQYLEIANRLIDNRAEGIVLRWTEIPLLIDRVILRCRDLTRWTFMQRR